MKAKEYLEGLGLDHSRYLIMDEDDLTPLLIRSPRHDAFIDRVSIMNGDFTVLKNNEKATVRLHTTHVDVNESYGVDGILFSLYLVDGDFRTSVDVFFTEKEYAMMADEPDNVFYKFITDVFIKQKEETQ